jgi:hypothetical protein
MEVNLSADLREVLKRLAARHEEAKDGLGQNTGAEFDSTAGDHIHGVCVPERLLEGS